ncbi:Lrp/AsnC family transcriptional regulator [Pseudonocardia alni]|uniref:Lrp/AsnC family transcriptional regulator n=1 Tax=Pseudonocardia alni TaxID=33907 RepID=UPI00280AC706|nr:Lrp/AsnC family transcriptional regulator [Pseudonocardia alni]
MDDIDRKILGLLRVDARMSVSDIGRRVGLSTAPVSRRIGRLEADGAIRGYVAVVEDSVVGDLDAFTEIRLHGGTDTREIEEIARQVPEVQQCFTIAGDLDVLVRFRVRNVDHLQQVVNAIRRTGIVAGTKTLIVMSSWDRAHLAPGETSTTASRGAG